MVSGWSFRAATLYAWAAAIGYVSLVAAWSARTENLAASPIVARALMWISYAGALAAWTLARNVEAEGTRLGLDALAMLRGASPRALASARVVAVPAVALTVAVVVLVGSTRGAIALVASVLVYALLFGATFGGLARLASRLNPRHGRLVFVALVVGPELLRGALGDDMPTFVSGFGSLLDVLLGFGVGSV